MSDESRFFAVDSYVRIRISHPGFGDRYNPDTNGRVGRITKSKLTKTRGLRLNVSGFARRPDQWASFSPEDLDPATAEDWEYQRCLDRLS